MKVFKDCGLRKTIQTNPRIVNFFDAQLNLDTSTYQPYRKTNNNVVYLNNNSNHPITILKELPSSIEKRISDISSNENVFTQSISISEYALQKSGFTEQLKYITSDNNREKNTEEKKHHKRKIIWFNPPYLVNVRNNIGKHSCN